ncbi:hypothetical protein KTD13_16640 [Burkholderia multivorans]|nr:hypothetical protein [Burkholderia multivorans]MBU9261985.1 hypothetical protein [Burkholderia multivorans]SAJ89275.1 hypothetical protein UA11_04067 [Burkholderia multivorans]
MKRLDLSDGFNFNEGGHLLTFFWSKRHRMIRLWVQLGRTFERRWTY